MSNAGRTFSTLVGEDFQIAILVKDKEELDQKRIKYIQKELKELQNCFHIFQMARQ